MKNKGFEEWDIMVALSGLKKGIMMDFGDRVKYAIKD